MKTLRRPLAALLLALAAALCGAHPAAGGAGDDTDADGNAAVDVLVIYTPAMVEWLGEDGVRAKINELVAEANAAFERSGVSGKLLLGENDAGDTAARRVEYTESTRDYMDDLNALSDWHEGRNSTMVVRKDGVMDEVHLWRNEFRADIVVLLRHGSVQNTAGIAWTLDSTDGSPAGGFAVVGAQLNTYCFPHELGHTFGLLHDRANSSGATGAFDYAYGYIFTGTSGAEHGTIMSYAQGEARRRTQAAASRNSRCAPRPARRT